MQSVAGLPLARRIQAALALYRGPPVNPVLPDIRRLAGCLPRSPMSISSPARRVRSGSMRLGLWASALAFLLVEGYALQDQWEIGHAGVMFMLGTALLSAGICIGLFALIAGIGLAASLFFSEQPQAPSGGIGPIDNGGNPRALPRIKPDTIRRPSLVSKRKGHFHRLGS